MGANSLSGYVECFNATHCCQICTVDKTTANTFVEEDIYKLQTEDNYGKHVKQNNYKETDIKTKCIFNGTGDYHCAVKTNVDLMHDFVYGICKSEIAIILYYIILFVKNSFLN